MKQGRYVFTPPIRPTCPIETRSDPAWVSALAIIVVFAVGAIAYVGMK